MAKRIRTPIDHNFRWGESEAKDKFEASRSPEYWEYRHKWEELPKTRTVSDFPIHLDIDVTNKCNLRCTMCPRTDLILEGKFWDIGEFDLDLYKNIVEDGIKYGMCSLKYNILGEPLLHPKLLEMIRFAKKIGVVDTMLNTNGSLLTPQLSRGVVNSGLDKLFFSFDSPNKEVYNKIRVGADYDKVLNKIRSFMKIRDSMKSITPLTRASMVVMKENEHEVEDFSILFSSIVDVVAYSIYLKHTGQELSEDKTAVQLHKDGKFCCPQLWQRMFVHTDGEVAVCCIDTARTIKIGNIFETTIRELWLGKEYQEVRKLHSSGKYDSIPTCRKCPLAQY